MQHTIRSTPKAASKQGSTRRNTISLSGVAFIVVSAAGFALQGLFARLASQRGATATTIGLGRFALTALILWSYAWYRRDESFRLRLPARKMVSLLALGAIAYFLGSFSYLAAVTYIPVSVAGLLLYTYPAIATTLAVGLGDERLSANLTWAIATTLLGTALTVGAPAIMSPHSPNIIGIGLILVNAVVYATYIVLSERVIPGIHTMVALAYISTGALFSFGLVTVLSRSLTLSIGWQGWSGIAGMALFSTVLAAGGLLAGLRRLGPARAATLSTVEPIFTVVFAAIVLGERLSVFQFVGGTIILVGVVLVIQQRTDSQPASS